MTTGTKPLRILVIDASAEDRHLHRRLLSEDAVRGYDFMETASSEEGFALCSTQRPDCVLLGHRLPDLDGLEVLARLAGPDGFISVPVVIPTAPVTIRSTTKSCGPAHRTIWRRTSSPGYCSDGRSAVR